LAVSYLLNRSSRTYAVAARVISEIRKMFPKFQPKSFLDFGAGLSSGAAACVDAFGDNMSVFSVEPGGKMRKLGKYLTSYSRIKHC
jgi:ribosomal protein RSM22 (predicted rRNA methylase)